MVKNSWWIYDFLIVYCRHQSEEDVGSAGEQPARNKVDAHTKKEG